MNRFEIDVIKFVPNSAKEPLSRVYYYSTKPNLLLAVLKAGDSAVFSSGLMIYNYQEGLTLPPLEAMLQSINSTEDHKPYLTEFLLTHSRRELWHPAGYRLHRINFALGEAQDYYLMVAKLLD